jgi:hypothetical protein
LGRNLLLILDKLEKVIMILYVCDRKRKVDHCYTHCEHGLPHPANQCTSDEVCYIGSKKGVVVKCRPATKEELAKYEKEQAKKKKPMGPWGN